MIPPIRLEKLGQLGVNLIHTEPFDFYGKVIGAMVMVFGSDTSACASAIALRGLGLARLTTISGMNSLFGRGPENPEVSLKGCFYLENMNFISSMVSTTQTVLTNT